MTLVSPQQVNPNDLITADSVNIPVNQLSTVINGQIDNTNISSLSGTKISAGTLPGIAMAEDANPYTRLDESLGDFVATGCEWTALSGLNGTMTAGVVYVDGQRLKPSAVASYTFTASRDTYVYIDNNGGVQYDPQTNGAAQPLTPDHNVLIAKVVTSGTAITSVIDLRRLRASSPVVGVIQASTVATTGVKAITGLGFMPSAVYFTGLIFSSKNTYTASGIGSPRASFSAANGPIGANSSTTACLIALNSSNGINFTMNYVSSDPDGFTVNVTIVSDFAIGYVAYP